MDDGLQWIPGRVYYPIWDSLAGCTCISQFIITRFPTKCCLIVHLSYILLIFNLDNCEYLFDPFSVIVRRY